MFRSAEFRDAEALARIYNQAMRPGANATAQIAPVSREDRVAWLKQLPEPYGAWVSEATSGDVIGWCALVPFAVRPRLPFIAELSVYVDESRRSGFVGARLLAYVVNEARRRGFRSLVSIASDKNIASVAGCVAYGFRPSAILREVGRLAGRLENAAWLQKDLLADDPPQYRRMRDSMLRNAGARPHALGLAGE